MTAATSPIASVEDLFGTTGKIVFGVQGFSGTLVSCAVGSDLIGIEAAGFLTAYTGTPDVLLSLLRGELDITSGSWSTVLLRRPGGRIRPLLQITDVQAADVPELADVPVLGGATGLAVSRARARGRDVAQAEAQAAALGQFVAAGRFVAAPSGLSPDLAACLEQHVYQAMTDPGLAVAADAAGRPLDVAHGAEAVATLRAAERIGQTFRPILERSIATMRG